MGRSGGFMAAAKWANTRASRRSVFANWPRALAKSRTCRGLTTTTGRPAACRALTTGISKPPVASSTISAGRQSISSTISLPKAFTLFAQRNWQSLSCTATSSCCLETSMPMKDFDFFFAMKLVLLPTLANAGSRPQQLFGFRENEGNDQGLPRGLKATKRVNDLLPSLANRFCLLCDRQSNKHFLTCMGLPYKRVGAQLMRVVDGYA